MLVWSYTLCFTSPVSVFSGLAAAGLVDRLVVRGSSRLPYIPGSTVKGRWRFTAERLLRGMPSSAVPGFGMHALDTPICKELEKACTICRLFGNPTLPSAVFVGNAHLLEKDRRHLGRIGAARQSPIGRPGGHVRPGIAISRRLGSVLGDHLFFDETVGPLTFQGELRIDDDVDEADRQWLVLSAGLVDGIGARKATGRGLLDGGIRIAQGN